MKAFAQYGMRVYMVDRSDTLSEVAESVKKEFQTHQCEIEPYVADVSKLKDVLDLRDEIVRRFGPVSTASAVHSRAEIILSRFMCC